MARVFLLLLIVIVAVAITESKKGQGKKGKKPNCTKIGNGFDACLKKGYKSKGCKSGDGPLKKKDVKKCNKVAKAIKKCPDYTCPKAPITKAPTKAPTEPPKPPTEAPTEPGIDYSCKKDGYDYKGADIRDFESKSFETCVEACAAEDGCQSVTFSKKSNNCWLKKMRGGESSPWQDSDRISMNIKCDSSPVDLSCLRPNKNFGGADLGWFKVADTKTCAELCRETEKCQSIAFRKSDNMCHLKKKRGGEKGPEPDGDFESMNIDCSPSKEFNPDDKSCVTDEFSYPGADLRDINSDGFEDCRTSCFDTADCVAFEMRKSDNHCWLKRQRGGDNAPKPQDGFLGANMECDKSPIDVSCARDNKNFWGQDLEWFVVIDDKPLEICAGLCREADRCQSVSFRKSDKMCHLKAKRGGEKGPEPDDNYESMNIDCAPNKEFDASDRTCAKDNTNFPGNDLRDFQSSGFEDCHTSCFDAADCKSFSVRKSDNHCWIKHSQNGFWGAGDDNAFLSMNMEC